MYFLMMAAMLTAALFFSLVRPGFAQQEPSDSAVVVAASVVAASAVGVKAACRPEEWPPTSLMHPPKSGSETMRCRFGGMRMSNSIQKQKVELNSEAKDGSITSRDVCNSVRDDHLVGLV
jgi:hypothetical protein